MEVLRPDGFTTAHAEAVLKFLARRPLSAIERTRMYRAFDLLHRAVARDQTGRRTFRQLYDQEVEQTYADRFLDELLAVPKAWRQATSRRQTINREIVTTLTAQGWFSDEVPDGTLLVAYCVFWWTAFAKGYAFEIEVFQDLQASGVQFVAHNLRLREERFSPYDLVVLEFTGDIKTSPYFLFTARTVGLTNDFYITQRMKAGERVRWLVFSKRPFWEKIDGGTIATDLTHIARVLPSPAEIWHDGTALVVVEYALWKEKVLRVQAQGEGYE